MKLPRTSFKNTAACGALVGGASWGGSGIAPGLVVVDSSRPAMFALKPAAVAGIASRLHTPPAAQI